MANSTIHHVTPGPNRRTEREVRYYPYAADFFDKHFGARPSRNTLYKYLLHGYPVVKNGPYVQMPIYRVLGKWPKTTVEAMDRMLTLIRHLETQHRKAEPASRRG